MPSPLSTDSYFKSPLGWIRASHRSGKLVSLGFTSTKPRSGKLVGPGRLRRQLTAYFKGSRVRFKVPVREEGTFFQKRVWKTLRAIPAGKTLSYKEAARRAGVPRAIRAAASAIGSNPLMILTPCHRVIGSDGSLTGYAYGLKKKRWLLRREGCRL